MEIDNKVRKIILLTIFMLMIGISVFVFSWQKHYAQSLPTEDSGKIINIAEGNGVKSSPQKQVTTIKIYVTGEVQKPGFYNVEANMRGLDAINLAGGFTEAADIQKVNVTRILKDGTQINVPALKKNTTKKNIDLGEKKKRVRSFKRPALANKVGGYNLPKGVFVENIVVGVNKLVSINNGTLNELNTLPGIYPELSKRIIKYRSEYGFTTIYDLMKVKGISPARFAKLKSYITL